jgi:hypothetical protein
MRLHVIEIAALLLAAVDPAFAQPATTAKPDAALVERYESNKSEHLAKVAECRKMKDAAQVLTDVSCMSAQEVSKRNRTRNLQNKCRVMELASSPPRGLKDGELEQYLNEHSPKQDALERCGKSKEQWVREELQTLRRRQSGG